MHVAVNDRRYRRGVAAHGRRYGGRGREARGVGDAAPYGGKFPALSLRDQLCISSGNQICRAEACIFGPSLKSADWSWQSASPVPFSNVFKWQFENTTILNSQFSIFNSPGAGGNGGQ